MSKIALSGNASGTGTLTIAAPNTSTDQTLTLPDATGTILTTATPGVPIGGPAFSAYLNSAQTITSATSTKVTFDAEEFDTNSNFASSRFTPTVAGYYQVSAFVGTNSVSATYQTSIYKNGAIYKFLSLSAANGTTGPNGSVLVYLNGSTDYIEVYVYLSIGQALAANARQTYFQGALIRSAT